jgi:hypothetical protein
MVRMNVKFSHSLAIRSAGRDRPENTPLGFSSTVQEVQFHIRFCFFYRFSLSETVFLMFVLIRVPKTVPKRDW